MFVLHGLGQAKLELYISKSCWLKAFIFTFFLTLSYEVSTSVLKTTKFRTLGF